MTVQIREIRLGGNLRPFLEVVDDIYGDDPAYVRPLDMLVRQQLSRKNPFFEHAQGTIFVAFRDRRCVGRVTAQIDKEHLARYGDSVGFFGFFDTIDDVEVARALLDRAGQWLQARDMKFIRGPLSLCTNEEVGCLVDGFDTPPMIMMTHHRSYQGGLIEAAGFEKLKDLYAWHYTVGEVPERARKAHEAVKAMPEVKRRRVDLKHLERDVRVVMDIYNDAWSENWGFVPLTESELRKMASDMRLLLMPELTQIVEIDGEPVGVGLALPNINELIGDLHGKLFGAGLFKLLWRLKVAGPKTARLIILGIRHKIRQNRRYAPLSTYMYVEMNRSAERVGVKSGELSWTLEDNAPVNVGIRFMGGKVYKTYRVYQRSLQP